MKRKMLKKEDEAVSAVVGGLMMLVVTVTIMMTLMAFAQANNVLIDAKREQINMEIEVIREEMKSFSNRSQYQHWIPEFEPPPTVDEPPFKKFYDKRERKYDLYVFHADNVTWIRVDEIRSGGLTFNATDGSLYPPPPE